MSRQAVPAWLVMECRLRPARVDASAVGPPASWRTQWTPQPEPRDGEGAIAKQTHDSAARSLRSRRNRISVFPLVQYGRASGTANRIVTLMTELWRYCNDLTRPWQLRHDHPLARPGSTVQWARVGPVRHLRTGARGGSTSNLER